MNSILHKLALKYIIKHSLYIVIISLFISKLISYYAFADEHISSTQEQLNKISSIVADIEEKLKNKHENHKVIRNQLEQLEREIGYLHKEIERTKREISTSQRKLEQLEQQSDDLKQNIIAQDEAFNQQIRLAYSSSSQSKWKVLLSQSSLQNMGRNAVIYDFIHQARLEQINTMQELAKQVEINQQALQSEVESLQKLLKKNTKEQNSLTEIRKDNALIQAQLSQSIAADTDQLAKEKARQNKLKKLLKNLTLKHSKGKFNYQKGKLFWPTNGKLKSRFGSPRQSVGQNQWNGVLIQANKGAEVKAIFPGTVVFSDWFDHYGWLIIIDHGQGYMSLYAHAEGLYKRLDDEVTTGELIAVVGDTGDIDESGLYFEIRRQGEPVDPAHWCTRPNMAYSP